MASLEFLQEAGTLAKIDQAYVQQRKPRGYLGLSQAGHECSRWRWFTYHGYDSAPINGRVLRLFELGNMLEDRIISDLQMIGCTVTDQQKEVVYTQGSLKLIGHIDGVVTGLVEAPKTAHLLEIKTASSKRFNELKKHCDYKKFSETYWFQIHAYSLFLGLKRAAVFVYNKDNSEMMLLRIKIDKDWTVEQLQRIFESVGGEMPDRLCPRSDYYKAKFCNYCEVCFGSKKECKNSDWL